MIIDSFAGGGGASTGIEMALGRSPDVAINHSAAALALHAANHPETLHLDSNIWDVAPREVTKGKHVGLLWASPDCKHFSKAKGGAPKDRNIRDLAWVIVRWMEEVKPDVVAMENVEEFRTWGPIDNEGQPIPEFIGQTFNDWCRRIRKAGYRLQWKELRACDYGAPTIRKRFFMIARRDGRPIVWPKPTHGDPKSPEVKRGKLLPWRTAAECIDFTLPCPSIFDTAPEIMAQHGLRAVRPLKPNTLARVARGVKRYVLDASQPFLVNLTHGARVECADEPFRTITGAHRGEKALVAPSITRFNGGATGWDLRDPAPTILAQGGPLGIIAPALVTFYGHGEGRGVRSADLCEPLRTVTVENRHALIAPSLLSLKGTARRDFAADSPHATVLAGGGHSALLTAFISRQFGNSVGHGAEEPSGTITAGAGGKSALISPSLISVAHGDSGGRREYPLSDPMGVVLAGGISNALIAPHVMTMRNAAKPFNGADEPTHTITAGGAGLSCVAPVLTYAQHGGSVRDVLDPVHTIAASRKDQNGILAPFFAKYYGTGDGSRADAPLHTITVKDRMAHVQADLAAPTFGPEHHARARAVAEFLRAHDAWHGGEFVTLTIDGIDYVMTDIGMRMLTPRELFNAQGFPPDYVIEGVWLGQDGEWHWKPFPKDVQVSCCGNSVCPDLARALISSNCQHLIAQKQEQAA
jgi:DNA (cytosine-5)-methyltransferase 1